MIIKALNATIEYVLEQDKKVPEDQQTVFVFRQPNLKEQLEQRGTGDIEVFGDPSKADKGESDSIASVKTVIKSDQILVRKTNLVRACLVEIKNLVDDQGKTVIWTKKMNDRDKDKILASLLDVIPELADSLIKDIGLTEEEEGN